MDVPEGLQAAARGIEFRKTAAFLLNQVIFNSATAFGCIENIFPIRSPFSKQNLVTFRRVG